MTILNTPFGVSPNDGSGDNRILGPVLVQILQGQACLLRYNLDLLLGRTDHAVVSFFVSMATHKLFFELRFSYAKVQLGFIDIFQWGLFRQEYIPRSTE